MDARIMFAVNSGWDFNFVKGGNSIVVVTGWRAGSGFTNTVRIITVPNGKGKKAPMIHVLSSENAIHRSDE
jgi:pyruvate kinase